MDPALTAEERAYRCSDDGVDAATCCLRITRCSGELWGFGEVCIVRWMDVKMRRQMKMNRTTMACDDGRPFPGGVNEKRERERWRNGNVRKKHNNKKHTYDYTLFCGKDGVLRGDDQDHDDDEVLTFKTK